MPAPPRTGQTKTVAQIKSSLLRPATTSHFEVELGMPEFIRNQLGSARQEPLLLMCDSASLPGSQLATTEISNDFTGVTERHAYRRMFDDRLDLTFYVDAENYLPIRFFEAWISFITNESTNEARGENYFYRMRYPEEYTATGLKVRKFEKDYRQSLEYEFIKSWPIAITSTPVSYDGSSLLKLNVSMTYIRYVVSPGGGFGNPNVTASGLDPFQQSQFNDNGISDFAARVTDNVVDFLTGNDAWGDAASQFVRGGINRLGSFIGNIGR